MKGSVHFYAMVETHRHDHVLSITVPDSLMGYVGVRGGTG